MSEYKRLHVTTKHVDEWYAEPFRYPMLVDSDGKVVGMCLSSDAGYDHLFAAAPEMLEALEEVVAIQEKHRTSARLTHICMIVLAEHARTIIAKAKGESHE
jgi:gamma-glutamylcyclotransferase (GGCT)/AIG2-like uncharacterized protein YtfP